MRHSFIKGIPAVTAALLAVMLLGTASLAQDEAKVDSAPEVPGRGISITLPIYSGRPNPVWWITEEDDLRQVIRHIESLKAVRDTLFDYDEWNRLGYSSFIIAPLGMKGLPAKIHIWRDMALIAGGDEGERLYARGAAELYDMLAGQAEERGYREYFVNYRRQREERE